MVIKLATITSSPVQSRLQLSKDRAALMQDNKELSSLLGDYESTLGKITDMIRNYAHENSMATIAIHRQYNDMLEQERAQNLELRQEHAEWQARLVNLSKMLRELSQVSTDDAEIAKECD